jgi:hypothetical protein
VAACSRLARTARAFRQPRRPGYRQTRPVLATSSYFPNMNTGILVTPGYGGPQYFLTANGHIIGLQVEPGPPSDGSGG